MLIETTPAVPAERLLEIIALQSDLIRAERSVSAVMNVVVESARAFCRGADGAVIEIVDGDDLVYRAGSGLGAAQMNLRLARAASLSGRCVADNAVLVCDDADADARVDRAACRRVGMRSAICVPLVYDCVPIGVLKVLSSSPRAFAHGDALLLALLAEVVASSMTNARVFEAVAFRNARASAVVSSRRR